MRIYFVLFQTHFVVGQFTNKPNDKRDNLPVLFFLFFLIVQSSTMQTSLNIEQRSVNEYMKGKTDLSLRKVTFICTYNILFFDNVL